MLTNACNHGVAARDLTIRKRMDRNSRALHCYRVFIMGVYYKAACDEAKEQIDPGHIDDLGVKANAIAHPDHPFGPVVVFAMLHRWKASARIANDSADDDGYFAYADVTEEVLAAYNEQYKTQLKFTGKSR